MPIGRIAKTVVATSAATMCAALFALGLGAGAAGASTLTSSDGNTSLSTTGTITPGTPYSSGQTITVAVTANSVINTANLSANSAPTTGNFFLEECTDPSGLPGNLPSHPTDCEAATVIATPKTSTGALTKGFTVFDLPDAGTLGGSTMSGTCDIAPNQCVIGIFAASPQSGGFGFPHLFSAPFQVDQQADFGSGAEAGLNPGDGTPEVPLAIGLPLAAVVVLGGWTLRNRRRRQQQAA